MDDTNQKATKELADMIHYVADESIKDAPYDVTRNARVTKVYYNQITQNIIGYDIKVDDKDYHLNKERGKGVIAKKNDIVKLHFPCNNPNYMYLSYAHDPEDFVRMLDLEMGTDEYSIYYNSGFYQHVMRVKAQDLGITFPIKTEQFSYYDVSLAMVLPKSNIAYSFKITCDNSVWGVVRNYNVTELDGLLTIRLYNDNPDKVNPITKNFNIKIEAEGFLYPTPF